MAPGPIWTKEDCDKLNQLVERYGKKWTPIASFLGSGKTGKQCRRQWEKLNIVTKQCGWAPEEDALLLELHARYGNKWTRISRVIGGRTDNAVKNRYHAIKLKRKAKYLTGIDSAKLIDDAVVQRHLKNCNSLEERRAEKEHAQRVKKEERLQDPEGRQFKSEATNRTGFLSFDDWVEVDSCFPSKMNWAHELDNCKIPCSSAPYGIFAPESMSNGPASTYTMNLANDPVQGVMAPSMVSDNSNRMVDDSDSMESTAENKLPPSTTQSDGLSIYDGRVTFSSPFMIGTMSHPLPSSVVGHQFDTMNFGDGHLISEVSSPKKNRPNLTLDLTFQHRDGFDFDSFLHSVSPMSPTAYVKFLNCLSPIPRQASTVSDHESHMKA